MKLLYFGWVRTRIGKQREDLTPPPEVKDVRGLIDWLSAISPGYAEAFKEQGVVKVAVNQELGDLDTPIAANDEVALFPPMTGG